MTSRRAGIWVANGYNPNVTKMYSWKPSSLTVFYDYIQQNSIQQYKEAYPDTKVIVRFQHPQNWLQDIAVSANNTANELISKWKNDSVLRQVMTYGYFGNEMNLHYECGDPDPNNQWMYQTEEHYERLAWWTKAIMDKVKNECPDMPLLIPPMASGHEEDGQPDADGNPKIGWAGYDYFYSMISEYSNGVMPGHFYWGGSWGDSSEWLYGEDSEWYAFRWKKVLQLFATRYDMSDLKIVIDEAGNFNTGSDDFTNQLVYYSKNTLNHPQIEALTYFLWYDPTNSHGNIPNDWYRFTKDLDKHLEVMKETVVDTGGTMSNPFLSFEASSDVIASNLEKYYVDSGSLCRGSVIRVVPVQEAEKRMGHAGLQPGMEYYKLISAKFLDESQANGGVGTIVRVLDKNGSLVSVSTLLHAWPSERLYNDSWDNSMFDKIEPITHPGGEGKIDPGRSNYFPSDNSEDLGPYVYAVADKPSDWVGGGGLPHNKHVQYVLDFKLTVWGDEPTDPEEPTDPIDPEVPEEPTEIVYSGSDCALAVASATAAVLRAANKISSEEYLDALSVLFADDME